MSNLPQLSNKQIENRIFKVREAHVMVDYHLAELFQVETKRLNEQVKRNIKRFPTSFMFQLTENEWENLQSQIATADKNQSQIATTSQKYRSKFPYAFTEQGVAMLSAVLNSDVAINVSIQIINAFVEMRKFITVNASVFSRLSNLEQNQIQTDLNFLQTDTKINKVLNALEAKEITPKQNIFYNGQVFDAYTLIADIIRSAQQSIILIDNYIDDSVFKQLTKRNKEVTALIYSKATNKVLKQDLEKHNEQYPKITLKKLTTAHDRFMIIDEKIVYHFGASLKDTGKKWFAFSKLEIDAKDILEKLKPNE